MQRKKLFDENRGINLMANQYEVEELLEVIRRQAAELQELQQQTQRQQQEQQQRYDFDMTPRDVIDQFRRLKPLDEKHNSRAFIKAVEANIALCGGNQGLQKYCIQIVTNEKILGTAGQRVRELEENATWAEVKEEILQGSRPRKTYAEIFNFCRTVKVRNLSELFKIFEQSKFDINEIFVSDPLKPGIYKPQNVDRDLVDIFNDGKD